MRAMIRAAAALALSLAAFTASAGCNINRATGEKVCIYSGSESGWAAVVQFATVDGAPFLVLTSNADAGRIEADEVLFRVDDGGRQTYTRPVHAGNFASNCFWGVMLVGSCIPTSTVFVKLDAETMDQLANTKATIVTAKRGNALAHPVKLKGRQMAAWRARMPTPPPSRTANANGARIAPQAAAGGHHGAVAVSNPNPTPTTPGQNPNPTNPAERNNPEPGTTVPDENAPRPANPSEAEDDANARR